MKRLGFALLGLFLLAPLLAAAVIITLGSQAAESCDAGGAASAGGGSSLEMGLQGGAADSLTASQRRVVARVIAEGRRRQIPTRGIVTAVAVAGAESRFRVYANDGRGSDLRADQHGVDRSLQLPHDAVGTDHGSLGVFQQQWPWWGSMRELMDPGASAGKFYTALMKVPRWESLPVTVLAQRVQRSAAPSAYTRWESFATSVVAQATTASTSTPVPFSRDASTGSDTSGAVAGVGLTDADAKAGFGPEARRAAAAVRSRFGFTGAIHGYRNDPDSKHLRGLAIDVMTTDKAFGDRIAAYFIAHHGAYHVDNILWRQRITNAGRGWTFDPMKDRGSVTANHYDHVHVDFLGEPSTQGAGADLVAAAVQPGDGQDAADVGVCVPCPVDGGGTLPASVPVSAPARGGDAGVRVDTALSQRSASDGSTIVDGHRVSVISARQLRLAEQASGIDFRVMQGGYGGSHYGPSGTSHNYPGVMDLSPATLATEKLLRQYGFAAWARNIPGRSSVGSGAHLHAVSLLEPGNRRAPQVYGSWPKHGNGLSGANNDPAPHYAWVPGLVERVGGVELAPSVGDPGIQPGLQPLAAQCVPGTGGGSLSALGPAKGPSYELATFNILGANHHRGAPWRKRLAATKSLLAKHGVDVAALQEVHPPQSNALPGLLGGTYARYYTAKRPDNQLIWRRDMFTIDRSRSRMVPITYFHGHTVPMPLVRLVRNSTGQGAYYFGVHNPASVHGPAAHLRTKAVGEAWAAIRSVAGTREPVYYVGDMNDKQRFANMIRGKLRSAMVPGYTGIDWITQTGGGTAGRAFVDDSPLVDLASDHPFVVARVATSAGTGGTAPVAASTPPSSTPSPRERWAADVRTAMRGANTYIADAAATTRRPAINLDFDNTSLATGYATGRPVGPVLRFARTAHRNGVAVWFNTGRWEGRHQLVRQLRSVGYPVDGICLRTSSREPLAASKQRCRTRFTRDGYQLVANVGNRATDFTGGGYGRGFKLPDYSGRLP